MSFGADIYCDDSLQPRRVARGLTLVAQRCKHRLMTPRGSLRGGPEERNFGLDVIGMLGSVASAQDAEMLAGQIESELLKDRVVESVDVTFAQTEVSGGHSFAFSVHVFTAEGSFSMSATDVTLAIVGL